MTMGPAPINNYLINTLAFEANTGRLWLSNFNHQILWYKAHSETGSTKYNWISRH